MNEIDLLKERGVFMKKSALSALLSSFVLFSALLVHPTNTRAAGPFIETQKQSTPVYENRTGSLELVGYLNQFQQFPLVKEINPNWFQVKYGNSNGYILKSTANSVLYPNYENVNVKYKDPKETVITLKDTPVFDNTSGKLVQFATIKENRRYPILYPAGNWYAVDVSGRIGFIYKGNIKLDKGIPVLMYHHLLKSSENINFRNSSTITPEQFKQQMEYLHLKGYETITTSQLEQYIRGNLNLPGKTVLITFDDGLKTVFLYAYPILKQYNMKAAAFLITSRITNTPSNFNPRNLQTLSKVEIDQMKDVFEFQGHTHQLHSVNSKNKSAVVTQPLSVVRNDLMINKAQVNAKALAYPFGQYNASIINILKQTGFTSAYTTHNAYVHIGDDPYQISRFGIEPQMTFEKFRSIFE